ncbi:transcription-repair coupling factor [Weissella paramesenteroides]|uniref:transcription-repair coupling factor n=1 Tax=Weissella paramesenteroides TaxID=1249 RepID=UPI0012399814|nr:transcription-repair coupling factor [Weissella paramesenteroides]KAA8455506.1 transcription-repair coupling factor [Weissella paramesenteroides]KAA8459392.1 transcription-repair coupling factor [Weissella paramesenteroides]KAA8459489.1 transcription-repair coupling factor [Weissella paramesenteroides]KAA8460690.1 transcription-repair coupling factor [Weissella paramesenteroides]KAA8460933.1 transcription-repair coupling factor [Weissella paramesenteroides]
MQLTELLQQDKALQELATGLTKGGRHLMTGISGTARTVYLAALQQRTQQPMVIVSDSQFHADQLAEDLQALLGNEHVAVFPAEESLAAEMAVTSLDTRLARVSALHLLLTDPQAVVVTGIAGAQRYLPPVKKFQQAQLTIDFDHEYELKDLEIKLHQMGYHRNTTVEQPGEFAIRGSIVDVYPLDADYPVRLDFFDTELDSMRSFDAENQRSIENIDSLTILPATDLVLSDDDRQKAKTQLELAMTKQRDQLAGAEKRHLTEAITPLLTTLADGQILPEMRAYLHMLYPDAASLFDYLPANGIVVFDDYPRAIENAAQMRLDDTNWWAEKLDKQQVLTTADFGWSLTDQARDIQQASLIFSPLQRGIGQLRQTSLTNVTLRPTQQFFGQMPLLKGEVTRWQKQNMTVIFLTNSDDRQVKLVQTLNDFGIKVNQVSVDGLATGRTQSATLPLSAGFELPMQKLVVLTEKELFQQVRKRAPKRQTLSNAERIKSYNELKPGDYVVHVNHGIGIYEGMQTIENRGVKQDYITIAYQKGDKLFIPVTQLDLVQKYVGAAEKAPRINKMGGTEWQRAKAKVAKKVEDIADDLLALYAEREIKQGYAFAPDDEEMRRFEEAFPYPETPDQIRSVKEIKADMEKPRPMDRLLVGDVGFGKTEVAMRAAFKAAHEGKQVAMLVPTTILAQQHYDSFLNRFEGTNLKIAWMSRFQTKKQMTEIKTGLKNHTIDIIIGTHSLLAKDVAFGDLGLLIIDEEQRFGVKHKERLKSLQTNVDVLTLTATPIPRTLNMAMVGVRDLSVIETPPANRYPIQTYVMEQNGRVIANAIEREMARGGQTFYLHNRVADIEKVAGMIQSLVPEAQVAYIHGQMTETQMEGILVDFINGEYDVLVTTTIIETGVDIPNANTLFVENADYMGLAQLYQLRGRVGRSNNVAYAYFTYPGTRSLNEESEKRLTAIRDFTELGSGFKIAMRDLSIRGAGDLLGQSQHGFINAVGYDLYTQMLQEAVAAKQGKKQKRFDSELDLQVEAYLPADYVADGPQKIDLYQRIRKATKAEQFAEITDDLVDRFGDIPAATNRLLTVSQLKAIADQVGVAQIKRTVNQPTIITIRFDKQAKITREQVQQAMADTKTRGQIKVNDPVLFAMAIQPKQTDDEWLQNLIKFLSALLPKKD